jgi:hypothetical protein
MAAFLRSHIFTPAAALRRASVFAPRRVQLRRSTPLAATAARLAVTAGEFLFFLWTLLTIGFSFLVAAGFFA